MNNYDDNYFKKIRSEVKVKFTNGKIIGFRPFSICCSVPSKYAYINYSYDKNNYKKEFCLVSDMFDNIETNAIETNNIEYLEEVGIKTIHMKLNYDL